MKKIGLVTYYGDNFGACMQAYALQTSLKKIGGNCEIVACPEGIPHVKGKRSKFSMLKNAIKALFEGNFVKHYKTRECVLRTNKNIHNKCEEFRQNYLNIIQNGNESWEDFYVNIPEYDIFVCGSDQIWNPTFYGCCHPIYYLDFVPNEKKRVAYAPSIGIKNIEECYQKDLKKFVEKFDSVSVREFNSISQLQSICDKEIEWVLDPTLLLRKDEYDIFFSRISIPQEPYIFCYLFGDKDDTEDIKNRVKDILGFKVVSIPFVSREILSSDEKFDDAGPIEFINLIKNAAFVLTDSFHATAFSINFQVPFISLLRQKDSDRNEMSSRLYSLLNKLHLEERLVKNIADIPQELLNVDFSKSNKLLEQYRKDSISFLERGVRLYEK